VLIVHRFWDWLGLNLGRHWILVMVVNHANANSAQPALDAMVEWVYGGAKR